MAGINMIGSYSGFDNSMIDKLMETEKLPLVQLANKKTTLTDKQNAWRDINTRLNSLFEKTKALQNSDAFTAKISSSTDESFVTASASKNAAEGTYKVHVEKLADSTSIISGKIVLSGGSTTTALGISGSFTITNNDETGATITIEEEDTLKTIAENINAFAKDTSINAEIIDGRLVLTDSKTGNRNIRLTGDGKGTLKELGLNIDARTVNQGANAQFTINGVSVERSTNSISDVMGSVTINLKKEHTAGEYETIKVSLDTGKATKAIQDFISQYNSTMTFIESKLAVGDPKVPGSAGTLAGDGTLIRLHSTLRSYVTSRISNMNTDIQDISALGVTTVDKYGQLKLDAAKFSEALAKHPKNVISFFFSKTDDDKQVGYVPRLKEYIDSFISSSNGVIKGKTESFERTLKDINKQIESFNARMEKKEAYYIKLFTALDVALMRAESQTAWLQGQIDAMNAATSSKK